MQVKSFLLTLGIGMAAGAAAATMLPRTPQVKQAVTKAADSIESAVEQTKDALIGEGCSCSGSSSGGNSHS